MVGFVSSFLLCCGVVGYVWIDGGGSGLFLGDLVDWLGVSGFVWIGGGSDGLCG